MLEGSQTQGPVTVLVLQVGPPPPTELGDILLGTLNTNYGINFLLFKNGYHSLEILSREKRLKWRLSIENAML